MKLDLILVLAVGAASLASAQASIEKVRAAEAYLAHGELAARMAANDLKVVFGAYESYFREKAPDDGARLLAESAGAFALARDHGEASHLLADPLFDQVGVLPGTRYLRSALAWSIDSGPEPERRSGFESVLGRACLIRALAAGEHEALDRLGAIAADIPTGPRASPTDKAILALAAPKTGLRELSSIKDPASWASIAIPLPGGGAATIYFFDPVVLFARARLLLLESGPPGASWTTADSTRAFLLGNYETVLRMNPPGDQEDYRQALWRIAAESRLGRDVRKGLAAYEAGFGADPQKLAAGALYLARYTTLSEAASKWSSRAAERGGDAPLYSQVASLAEFRAGRYADSFIAFRAYIDMLLRQPRIDSAEWISYYCMGLFENGRHDALKAREMIAHLSALERLDANGLVWVVTKCASQYYSDTISPTEYKYAK